MRKCGGRDGSGGPTEPCEQGLPRRLPQRRLLHPALPAARPRQDAAAGVARRPRPARPRGGRQHARRHQGHPGHQQLHRTLERGPPIHVQVSYHLVLWFFLRSCVSFLLSCQDGARGWSVLLHAAPAEVPCARQAVGPPDPPDGSLGPRPRRRRHHPLHRPQDQVRVCRV